MSNVALAVQVKLRIHVDVHGREFLSATGQKVVIASADLSDGNTVVIRDTLAPIADETTVPFQPATRMYISSRIYGAFDIIEVNYDVSAREGQRYVFTGSGVVSGGAGLPGYISIYYDAPPNSDRPVTVGMAALDGGATTPRPIDHYVVPRFETRLIPAPSASVWVFIARGMESGEVIPASILQPAGPASAGERGGAAARVSRGAPMFGGSLLVDLTATEQNVIHFDSTTNRFQYGP